jgi:hypothetical protein
MDLVLTVPPLIARLTGHEFRVYSSRYSPPIVVNVTGLTVANDDPLFLSLVVHNNARNLQVPLFDNVGLGARVAWTPSLKQFTHSQFL